MTKVSINIPGGGLITLLTIIFVIAKITGYIAWSWWMVFSPIWIVISLIIGLPIMGFCGAFIWFIYDDWAKKRRQRKRASSQGRWH